MKFLDNGTSSKYEDKNSGRITEQLNFKVEVEGKEKVWTVTKARTVNSLYGQIALLGSYHGNLAGNEFTLLVKYDRPNNKREYTVQEALPFIEEWNKQGQKTEIKEEEPQASPQTSLDEIYVPFGLA